jgi:hypothetical protein
MNSLNISSMILLIILNILKSKYEIELFIYKFPESLRSKYEYPQIEQVAPCQMMKSGSEKTIYGEVTVSSRWSVMEVLTATSLAQSL